MILSKSKVGTNILNFNDIIQNLATAYLKKSRFHTVLTVKNVIALSANLQYKTLSTAATILM